MSNEKEVVKEKPVRVKKKLRQPLKTKVKVKKVETQVLPKPEKTKVDLNPKEPEKPKKPVETEKEETPVQKPVVLPPQLKGARTMKKFRAANQVMLLGRQHHPDWHRANANKTLCERCDFNEPTPIRLFGSR